VCRFYIKFAFLKGGLLYISIILNTTNTRRKGVRFKMIKRIKRQILSMSLVIAMMVSSITPVAAAEVVNNPEVGMVSEDGVAPVDSTTDDVPTMDEQ